MKANNGSGNNEARDEWQTPKWLFKELDKQYRFSFDCCASQTNSKCKFFASKRVEFQISTVVKGLCWMNPPFSKADIMFKHFFEVVTEGVAIYRCDNFETKIWQETIFPNATWIFIPSKRIAYEGMEGKGSRFPSALVGFNVKEPKGLKGTLLHLTKQIRRSK